MTNNGLVKRVHEKASGALKEQVMWGNSLRMLTRISAMICLALQVCCAPSPSVSPPGENQQATINNQASATEEGDPVAKRIRRARSLVNSSECGFVEKMVKDQAVEADWHMNYFCAKQRIYLKLFVFDSQQVAIDYAESFMKKVEEERKRTQGNSRLELIHRWTVNGPLLFIIRGDNEITVNTTLSHFAGEE